MKVQDLLNAKEASASVGFQTFVLLTSSRPESLYCFFEGKDAPYYHERIKWLYGRQAEYIPCGGKEKVLRTRELIQKVSGYKKYPQAYFVDRDFDASIAGVYADVFETPTYSIENLYCSPESFAEFLRTALHLEPQSSEFRKALSRYQKLLNEFLAKSLEFNAWYILQKQEQESTGVPNNVSLSDSLIPAYIGVTLTTTVKKYNLKKIRDNFPNSIPVQTMAVRKQRDIFANQELLKILRGKFVFSFLIHFIRLLCTDACDKNKRTVLKKKATCSVDSTNALTLLTTFATTPESLKDFLKKY